MYYLLTPIHTHIDFGFGVTGDSFKDAADKLEESLSQRAGVLNELLPIQYLRRHAIELYLKSAIVIIHRHLSLPYGDLPPTADPHALVYGTWKPFPQLHSIKKLWTYLKSLFEEQQAFFDTVRRVDWTFPIEVDTWIDTIEERDPRSTFFRYPNPQKPEAEITKSVMSEGTCDEIAELMKNDTSTKHLVLLLENPDGEVTRGYYYDGNMQSDFGKILKDCVNMFYGMHAALRVEVCGGA